MKRLHRPNFYGWSVFDEQRNLDFHSVLWVREAGNVAIDPLPLSEHDAAHLEALGGVQTIIVTNSDHLRATKELARSTGARVLVPERERARFSELSTDGLGEGATTRVEGLQVLELGGSKTPGELALLVEGDTLVTGDLVRSHRAGRLDLLPDAKLTDKDQALASLRRLVALADVDAVLVGDGWPVFRDGRRALQELLDESVVAPG
jgi:hypothetical protein